MSSPCRHRARGEGVGIHAQNARITSSSWRIGTRTPRQQARARLRSAAALPLRGVLSRVILPSILWIGQVDCCAWWQVAGRHRQV
jgi:hypothetical protein